MDDKPNIKNAKRKRRVPGFFIGVGVYFVFSMIFSILLGETPGGCIVEYVHFLSLRQELSAARERWDANKPHRYQVRIRSNKFFSDDVSWDCYSRDPLVVFQDGEAIDGDNWELCKETYTTVSVDRIFEQIDQELSETNMLIANWKLEFDTHYGYVSRSYVRCHDSGLLISGRACFEILPRQNDGFDFKSFWFDEFSVLE
jgi:hypothetical protein